MSNVATDYLVKCVNTQVIFWFRAWGRKLCCIWLHFTVPSHSVTHAPIPQSAASTQTDVSHSQIDDEFMSTMVMCLWVSRGLLLTCGPLILQTSPGCICLIHVSFVAFVSWWVSCGCFNHIIMPSLLLYLHVCVVHCFPQITHWYWMAWTESHHFQPNTCISIFRQYCRDDYQCFDKLFNEIFDN